MRSRVSAWNKLIAAWKLGSAPARTRRPRRVDLSWDCLEERKVLSHVVPHHHAHHAAAAVASSVESGTSTTSTAGTTTVSASDSTTSSTTSSTSSGSTSSTTSSSSSSSTSSSTLASALQTLKTDIQTIESGSNTTIGELTAIMTTFEQLKTDGLTPSSNSALSSFEDSLVTASASGTPLTTSGTPNATLFSEFEALYTSSPTSQETTDLTNAYNALAAAVTSSNITSADITTSNNDYAAVLAAQGSTSTATFPYFTLVTGRAEGPGGPGGPGGMAGGCV